MILPDYNGMELLSAAAVERIYRRTDEMGLHRDWVIVPLACAETASESVLPDGKILLRPPRLRDFERWLDGLAPALRSLGLSRTARRGTDDPVKHLTAAGAPQARGTQTYLDEAHGMKIGRDGGGS